MRGEEEKGRDGGREEERRKRESGRYLEVVCYLASIQVQPPQRMSEWSMPY